MTGVGPIGRTRRSMTVCSRLTLLITCLGFAGAACASDIYRWRDDQGRVHFGDVVPERYRSAATRVIVQPADHLAGPPTDAAARATSERARAPTTVAPAVSAPSPPPVEASTGAPPPAASAAPYTGSDCDLLWQAYFASQVCFAPYQRIKGGTRVEAYEHCQVVESPSQRCGPPRP